VFTGIVESLAAVRSVACEGPGVRLAIEVPWGREATAVGDSIAVNGVCLTVVGRTDQEFEFQAGPETLARTNLGELRPGDRVNLERALPAMARLSGHFVHGHVDGVAGISERRREEEWDWMDFSAARELTDQMVPKGSVAVDGVSLTLVSVSAGRFRVMLIPHTLAHTTLGIKPVGAAVNVEIDILSKYVQQAVRQILAP
jgi:riboflavin synthase